MEYITSYLTDFKIQNEMHLTDDKANKHTKLQLLWNENGLIVSESVVTEVQSDVVVDDNDESTIKFSVRNH